MVVRGNGPLFNKELCPKLRGFSQSNFGDKIMDFKSFNQAVQQIADEKGIPKEKIYEAIEMALAAAYKRDYGKRGQIVHAKMDPVSGKVTMKQIKIVMDESMIKSEEEVKAEEEARVAKLGEIDRHLSRQSAGIPVKDLRTGPEDLGTQKLTETATTKKPGEPEEAKEKKIEIDEEIREGATEEKRVRFNPEKHLMIEEARKTKPDIEPGEELEFSLEYHEDFGRIAAQTAKQVIIQRIREIEREAVFEEYKGKEGELVSGIIQRVEGRNVFIDMGRAVGILPSEEQIPYERYQIGDRIKVLITLAEKNPRGSGVFLSRSHPRLLRKLFEIEVPEIASGTVEIKAVAREPGSRSKVAVVSHESGVDPVGSLVGQKGIRVSTVINELGGEKIDVIEWSDDSAEFVAHSLSPAKVLEANLNEKTKEAQVIVPEEQLSLAIGKGGQNVRLAAKLTGWKIDVRSKSKPAEVVESPEDATETSTRPDETKDENNSKVEEVKKD